MSLRRIWNAVFPKFSNPSVKARGANRRGRDHRRRFEPLESRWALTVPGASLSIDDVEVKETEGYAILTVSCIGALESVSVDYCTVDDTAEAGSDFEAVSGSLVFGVGVWSQTITVPITNDTLAESAEAFFVELGNAQNATIADGHGVATIASSDHPPVISGFQVVVEGGGNFTLSGSVSDEDEDPAGFVIRFGGVLAERDVTATVQVDGTFSVTVYLIYVPSGTATAQTTDSESLDSNLAECYL